MTDHAEEKREKAHESDEEAADEYEKMWPGTRSAFKHGVAHARSTPIPAELEEALIEAVRHTSYIETAFKVYSEAGREMIAIRKLMAPAVAAKEAAKRAHTLLAKYAKKEDA